MVFRNLITFGEATKEYYYDCIPHYRNQSDFFNDLKPIEENIVIENLNKTPSKPFKLFHKIPVEFKKPTNDRNGEYDEEENQYYETIIDWYNSKKRPVIYSSTTSFENNYNEFIGDFHRWVEETERKGSQVKFVSIRSVTIVIAKFNQLKGSSYICSPFQSKNIINIKNENDECFVYAVCCHFYHPETHVDRPHEYNAFRILLESSPLEINGYREEPISKSMIKVLDKLSNQELYEIQDNLTFDIDDMKYPVGADEIRLFEKNNPNLLLYINGIK